ATVSRSMRDTWVATAIAPKPIPCSLKFSGACLCRFSGKWKVKSRKWKAETFSSFHFPLSTFYFSLTNMTPFFPKKKSFRFVFVSAILTATAIGVALISVVAGQMGEYELAALGAKAALGLALIIVLYVAPRLAQNINFNSGFSVHVPNA